MSRLHFGKWFKRHRELILYGEKNTFWFGLAQILLLASPFTRCTWHSANYPPSLSPRFLIHKIWIIIPHRICLGSSSWEAEPERRIHVQDLLRTLSQWRLVRTQKYISGLEDSHLIRFYSPMLPSPSLFLSFSSFLPSFLPSSSYPPHIRLPALVFV